MLHPLADIKSKNIGKGTNVWQYSVILEGAVIGENCNINCHTFIENDVTIGNNVTVKAGVFLWDGIEVKDHVFIGPNASFTNDKYPRSKQYPELFQKTVLDDFASVGAGAIILGGVRVGKYAVVAAGALVANEVPDRALVTGIPARISGWVNLDGTPMEFIGGLYIDSEGVKWTVENNKLEKIEGSVSKS